MISARPSPQQHRLGFAAFDAGKTLVLATDTGRRRGRLIYRRAQFRAASLDQAAASPTSATSPRMYRRLPSKGHRRPSWCQRAPSVGHRRSVLWRLRPSRRHRRLVLQQRPPSTRRRRLVRGRSRLLRGSAIPLRIIYLLIHPLNRSTPGKCNSLDVAEVSLDPAGSSPALATASLEPSCESRAGAFMPCVGTRGSLAPARRSRAGARSPLNAAHRSRVPLRKSLAWRRVSRDAPRASASQMAISLVGWQVTLNTSAIGTSAPINA
jgi:hypothetical protein